MPIKTISIFTFGWISLPIASAVVATLATPTTLDAWAAVGASVGAMIAVIENLKKDRSWSHLASVLASSWFLGLIAPAVLVTFFKPEIKTELSWHAWAGMGFLVSLVGWAMTAAVLAVAPALGRWVVRTGAGKSGIPLPTGEIEEPYPPRTKREKPTYETDRD
jgi:hypothetical protein